ncbi:MAG: hypothetical protein ACRDAM_20045 [Casimicrobium sp.]
MKPISELSDEEFLALARESATLRDAPNQWVNGAVGLWAAREKAANGQAGNVISEIVERIRAVLSVDSWALTPLASGLRSMPSQTRHLLFSAQGRDVDLRINPSANAFALSGQVLGPDEFGAVEVAKDDEQSVGARSARIVTFDGFGAFTLNDVAPGTYYLTLRMHRTVIELPPIRVGERGAKH